MTIQRAPDMTTAPSLVRAADSGRQLPTWTVTSADRPGRIGTRGGVVQVILTGTRCTTLTKLPVALSGGIIENRAPVAGDTVSTMPWNDSPGYASISMSTGSPVFIAPTWLSLKLAVT